MLRGGGAAHGPKPRNFATDLPKKMYHKAWRMALSYRYKRGQLVVVDDLGVPIDLKKEDREYWLKWALDGLGWGRHAGGHNFYITAENGPFSEALDQCHKYGRLRTAAEVDVKNLLEMKRLVVERKALQQMLREHQADLKMPLIGSAQGLTRSTAGLDVPRAVRNVSEAEMARAIVETQAQSSLGDSTGSFASSTAAAGAVAAMSSATSGMNGLSMDEVDRAAAEAEELLDDEVFDENEVIDEEDEEGWVEFPESIEEKPER
jgi:hypothetical protein